MCPFRNGKQLVILLKGSASLRYQCRVRLLSGKLYLHLNLCKPQEKSPQYHSKSAIFYYIFFTLKFTRGSNFKISFKAKELFAVSFKVYLKREIIDSECGLSMAQIINSQIKHFCVKIMEPIRQFIFWIKNHLLLLVDNLNQAIGE